MSVITFLLVLFVLVLVHEFGHYITAKWSRMRVDEFAIGFPPRIFSWKKGETEYILGAIPIGGYVKIYGENGEDAATPDTPRAFTHRPRILQALVLIAGVTMNILLAFVLYTATYLMGVTTAIEESAVTPQSELRILSVLEGSPADTAGFLPGDRILGASAGESTPESLLPSAVSLFIAERNGESLTLTVLRDGDEQTLSVVPELLEVPGGEVRPRVGFVMGLTEEVRYPFTDAVVKALAETRNGLVNITVGIGTLFTETIRGEADFENIAGPIGIAGLVGDASRFGLTALLSFTAIISLNLAVINLLPIPALDGGRLVVVGIEALIRRPLNARVVGYMNLAGFAFLMLLMILATWNDIVRIVG